MILALVFFIVCYVSNKALKQSAESDNYIPLHNIA